MLPSIIKQACFILLRVIEVVLLLRAVLSWLPIDRGNRFLVILDTLVWPILYPFRYILDRTGLQRRLPIDLSYIAAFITIRILMTVLF